MPLASSTGLRLEPLSVDHADAMVSVLADPELYAVIGGEPPDLPELRARYERQVAGPSAEHEAWLNWIVYDGSEAVGYVQATASWSPDVGWDAKLAWVVGSAYQGRGITTSATSAVVRVLHEQGVRRCTATIAPGHTASEAVAARLGLFPTEQVVDGERVWTEQ